MNDLEALSVRYGDAAFAPDVWSDPVESERMAIAARLGRPDLAGWAPPPAEVIDLAAERQKRKADGPHPGC